MEPDKYGHCVVCHRNLIYEQVIGGKVEQRFSPEYTEVEYLLDDSSKMRVAICLTCKEKITDDDKDTIMATVIEGWKQEVDKLDWTEEKKKNYMDKYSQLNIITRSDNMPDDILKKKVDAYKQVKLELGVKNVL